MFDELLKYYRVGTGKTQEEVAEAAGLDPSYVSRLESGSRAPKRGSVLRLGEALGITAEETDRLLLAADFRPVNIGSALYEPQLAVLDDLLYASSPQVRDDIRSVIRVALERGRGAMAAENARAS